MSDTLHALLSTAATFSAGAIDAVGPELARRLAMMEIHVAISTDPARARVLAVAPDGDVAVVHQAAVPAALGEAVGAFVNEALARVQPETRVALARLQAAGSGRLGVLVERDSRAVHLMVAAGQDLPMRLVTIQADSGVAH
ncbi:MAG: hypothetical protein IT180_10810 [Acidobacteria bacterium]|nr:hypothetical protein [Acidobacteriota bacterium]